MELNTTWNESDIFQNGQNRLEEQVASYLGSPCGNHWEYDQLTG